jgi:beta-N-acetylhexosaminidase
MRVKGFILATALAVLACTVALVVRPKPIPLPTLPPEPHNEVEQVLREKQVAAAEREGPSHSLRETLGQNFVVGIPTPIFGIETKEFLAHIRPGGIIIYNRNVKSREQLRTLISELQVFALETTGHRYIIMIDEEPGSATRLGLFRDVHAPGPPDWQKIEAEMPVLEEIGIDVDLAPLADFPFNEESFIKKRVPAASIPNLIEFNRKFIALLCQHRVSATLKHFPGMGIFAADPHKQLPVGDIDPQTLDTSLKIFQDGINSGADFVMTGHALYSNVDPENAATVSHKIVTGLLRDRLHFRGLVITDDLSQMALAKSATMSVEEATIAASKAGVTLLMFSHDFRRTRQTFDNVLQRAEQDKELQSILQQNCKAIVEFKHRAMRPVANPSPAQMAQVVPGSHGSTGAVQ